MYVFFEIPREFITDCYFAIDRDAEDVVLKEFRLPCRAKICGGKDIPYSDFSELLRKIDNLSEDQMTKAEDRCNVLRCQKSGAFRCSLKKIQSDISHGRQITLLDDSPPEMWGRYVRAFKELQKYLKQITA